MKFYDDVVDSGDALYMSAVDELQEYKGFILRYLVFKKENLDNV